MSTLTLSETAKVNPNVRLYVKVSRDGIFFSLLQLNHKSVAWSARVSFKKDFFITIVLLWLNSLYVIHIP